MSTILANKVSTLKNRPSSEKRGPFRQGEASVEITANKELLGPPRRIHSFN